MWWPTKKEPEIEPSPPSKPVTATSPQRIPLFSLETILESSMLTGTVLLCYAFYSRYLRRFPTALSIPQSLYAQGRTLSGRVVFVGDGDNFRLYHTPGGVFAGWDWLRQVPYEHYWYPSTSVMHRFRLRWIPLPRKPTPPDERQTQQQQPRLRLLQRPQPRRPRKLSAETIHVRLCGIDAPECKSYGKSGQPFGPESRDWLRQYLLGRKVKIRLFSLDQYQRAVAKVTIRSWTGRKDVSSEMLRAGWAIVYESKFQAAFGTTKEMYQREEQYARANKNGMWKYGESLVESPAEYKKRMRLGIDPPKALNLNALGPRLRTPESDTGEGLFRRMIISIFGMHKAANIPTEKMNEARADRVLQSMPAAVTNARVQKVHAKDEESTPNTHSPA
ncbi:hypothetical protein V1509DRAFT_623901 [Lipomyces kononenkoae]